MARRVYPDIDTIVANHLGCDRSQRDRSTHQVSQGGIDMRARAVDGIAGRAVAPARACAHRRARPRRRSTRSSSAARSSSASTPPHRSSVSSAPTASPRATIPTSRASSASIWACRSSSCPSPAANRLPVPADQPRRHGDRAVRHHARARPADLVLDSLRHRGGRAGGAGEPGGQDGRRSRRAARRRAPRRHAGPDPHARRRRPRRSTSCASTTRPPRCRR